MKGIFKTYIKKPIPVQAVLLGISNLPVIVRILKKASIPYEYDLSKGILKIKTLEGWAEGKLGEHYLVKGVKNEFYFVRKDIFEETYEEIKLK